VRPGAHHFVFNSFIPSLSLVKQDFTCIICPRRYSPANHQVAVNP